MSETPLHYLSLAEVGARIAARELSPLELTRHMLDRIERLDARLHAYFTVTGSVALEEARVAEREIMAGRHRGPLHGVPIGIKDLCDTAGVRTTAGMRVMASRVPAEDAIVVRRLRNAGAVMLGKLATTEGAYAQHHPDFTPPVNPWNAEVWTGVSSSGSGVATAAGLCFAALGSDTGGSIRFPSAMNGLVGLKPTYGRVPLRGVFPMATSLDHVGPMCRTALDAAIVLDVIAGPDAADPTTADEPRGEYVAATRSASASLRGLRVGKLRHSATTGLDDGICRIVDAAIESLARLGAEVVDVELPARAEALSATWVITAAAEMLVAHREYFPARADDYGPALRMLLEMASAVPASEYARVHLLRCAFGNELAQLLATVDVLACPTVGVHAPASMSMLDPDAVALMGQLMRFTAPFNYSGSPTISVPCGLAPGNGVPVSLQLVGRHFDEATLLRIAATYEAASNRRPTHPPL